MKIWQKYLLRSLSTTFAFILFLLFAFYVLLDLSMYGVRFITKGPEITVLDLFLYYLSHFTIHLDLFLPLAFLLSTYKVLFSLGAHLELVALQMAGLSRKKLLVPFFLFAGVLWLFSILNHEYFSGKSISLVERFKKTHSKTKKKHRCTKDRVQSLILDDHSELVYQILDEEKQELFDVFWIRSDRDIWTMKKFSFKTNFPIGYFVDHLVREQIFQKKESFEKKIFNDFPLKGGVHRKTFIPFESRSLSTLFLESSITTSETPNIKTHLHYKLALSLLPFLFLFAAAPYGFLFSRKSPSFLIVSLSLFGFIICKTLFDSLLILGENKVLPPLLAMWFCPLFILTLSLKRFVKL